MSHGPSFDVALAHRYFSANCFNAAWELIEKPDRTPEDDERMIRLAHASLWHWTERPDCSPKNVSIGYWQAARIYAILGQADQARKCAELCLANTPQDDSFCLAYAFEALARAESIGQNGDNAKRHLQTAWQYAEAVTDAGDKQLLINDLKTLT